MTKRILFLLCLFTLIIACKDTKETKNDDQKLTRYNFPDVLDMTDDVHSFSQKTLGSMSDMGIWHSFSMNKQSNKSNTGGFVGPFLMRQQESFWLSPSVIALQIKDADTGSIIDLNKAQNIQNVFYPGLLEQSFELNGLQITLKLFHCDQRTSLVTAKITNKSGLKRNLQLGWKGSFFEDIYESLSLVDRGLSCKINDTENAQLIFENTDSELGIDGNTYSYLENPIPIDVAKSTNITAAFTYTFGQEESFKWRNIAYTHIKDVEAQFSLNEERWNGYITELFKNKPSAILDVNKHQNLAVKSLLTLMLNWRSSAGSIFHQGIVPSYCTDYFQGLWAWDSWKHAVAIAPFEPNLAKDQIRAMYDYQDEKGMIADCFFRDLSLEGVNWRNTKSPLSAWSIYEVYKASPEDASFLKEMYPKLVKYHEWWYVNRDHDNNGLCEYGSTDGTRIAAAWESGMDNAVRFDKAVVLENKDGAYSINQESVDLNSYLYAEKIYISKIAALLGLADDEKRYLSEAQNLGDKILSSMYSSTDGFFYDVEIGTHKKIKIQGPEGWSPLYNHLATAEQAKRIVAVIMDSTRFNTPMPFPTLSASHPDFNPQKGYWRGPVWLDQAYFAIDGMFEYGFENEARQMANKLVANGEGLSNSKLPIRENYHPITKEGLNARNFSWSAAHILMLFQ